MRAATLIHLFVFILFLLVFFLEKTKKSPYLSPFILLFIFWMFLSTSYSICLRPSIEELVRLVDYMVLAWILGIFVDKRLLNSLIVVIVTAGGVVAFAGIVFLVISGGLNVRIYSTFYQSDAFAGYLIILIPLAISLSNENLSFLPKVFSMVLSVILLSCLFMTHSRGGWLSLIVVFIVFLWALRKQEIGKVFFRLVFYLISAIMFVYFFPNISKDNPMQSVVQRATTIVDLEHSSVMARFQFWEGAVKISLNNPVMGIGLGNFGRVYPRFQKNVLYFSHYTHNYYAQMAAETGIIGFIFFMLIIFTVLFWGFRLIFRGKLSCFEVDDVALNQLVRIKILCKEKLMTLKALSDRQFSSEEFIEELTKFEFTENEIKEILTYSDRGYYIRSVGLFCGILGSMIHSFLDVDWNFPAIPQLFWIEIGMFFIFISSILPSKRFTLPGWSSIFSLVARIITGLILFLTLLLYLCFWKGEIAQDKARLFQEQGDSINVLFCLEEAIKWDPLNPEYHRDRGRVLFSLYKLSKKKTEYLDYAIMELEKAVFLDSYKAAYHCDLGHYYIEKYYSGKKEFLHKAREQFKIAIVNDPVNYPQFYSTLAQIYLLKQNTADAEKIYLKGANVMKNLRDINRLWSFRKESFRSQLIVANFGLAELYMSMKKIDDAKKYYARVLELEPGRFDANYGTGMAYLSEENYKKAEFYLLESISAHSSLNSNEILNWTHLVTLLKEHKSPFTQKLWNFLDQDTKVILESWDVEHNSDDEFKSSLINNINKIFLEKNLYDKNIFGNINLPVEIKTLLDMGQENLSLSQKKRLNRLLFEVIYGEEITKSQLDDISELYYLIGLCNSKEKNYKKAKAYLELSLKFNPKFIPTFIELGQIYEDEGQINRTRKLWQKALEIDPNNSVLKFLLDNNYDTSSKDRKKDL
ncbi:MAG TPA: O-antigen ligase family protein [Candidatus Eremiobacteraeota bacterium]|nr:O-antigen ligase family protein [Candidatus Eremiobacteraeota bacterium]